MALVSLSNLRTRVRRRADMEHSTFISDLELNQFINDSAKELYDILVNADEDYNTIVDEFTVTEGNTEYLPSNFYKLRGLDKKIGEEFHPMRRMSFHDRGQRDNYRGQRFNLVQYKLISNTVQLFPALRAQGDYRMWYVPEFAELLKDTDTFDGKNGFDEYVVVDAAIKCKEKEESDIKGLLEAKRGLLSRVTLMAQERDYSEPAMIQDVRGDYHSEEDFLA
jgi:hypothetical protein